MPLPFGRSIDLRTRTAVMGILNVTPDSFSDGGRFDDPERALRHAAGMVEDGAGLIDVGGESTRPGSAPVGAEEEIRRVVPVIAALRARFDVAISVDTVKAEVARRALEAGADLVNDVSALADPAMPQALARSGAAAILMHMRGTPATMQLDTRYRDVVAEVAAALRGAARRAQEAGIAGAKILLDPGIGFGKSPEGNLELLRRLPEIVALGHPVVVGASRKSFLGAVLGGAPVDRRLEGSLACAAVAAWLGARIVRVHDVRETVRVVRTVDAIRTATV